MTTLLSAAQRADLHAVLRAWYQTQPPAATLAEAETFAVAVGQVAAECVFEQGTQACGTRAGYQGPRLSCPCGQQARFVNYRQRWLRGRPGLVGVSRAYYHCRHCHTTDQRQGNLPAGDDYFSRFASFAASIR
jgi:hypothetical protein